MVAMLAGRPQDDLGWRAMMKEATRVITDVGKDIRGANKEVRGDFFQLRSGYSFGLGQVVRRRVIR
jgi:hypothetical protein